MRHQPKILKNHANPPPKQRQFFTRERHHILIEQPDQPTAWPLRKIKQLEQRGFTSPRSAGEKIKPAFGERKADIRQRFSAHPVAQADIFKLNDCSHNSAPIFALIVHCTAALRR